MIKYVFRCPHCNAVHSLERDGEFTVDQRCDGCGGLVRIRVTGPQRELSVDRGAAPVVTGPLESSPQALERFKREIDPKELELIFGRVLQAVAAVNEGNPDQAREHLATVMRAIAGLHGLIFLEVPTWCPPQSRAQMQETVQRIRNTIEQERKVGAQPSTGSVN